MQNKLFALAFIYKSFLWIADSNIRSLYLIIYWVEYIKMRVEVNAMTIQGRVSLWFITLTLFIKYVKLHLKYNNLQYFISTTPKTHAKYFMKGVFLKDINYFYLEICHIHARVSLLTVFPFHFDDIVKFKSNELISHSISILQTNISFI